jgi:SAM-dependent methyltransferase
VHGDGKARLEVEIATDANSHQLADVRAGDGAPVPLRWPVPAPRRFDLVLRLRTARAVHLEIGPQSTPRTELLPLLRGNGVEVGPGLNPSVRPGRGVTVRYVEKKHPSEWAATYAKRELTKAEQALWEHYVVDSARHLRGFAPGSLDFVFSHHVLEHLVDPIGTLLRWWDRLAPGGVLAGVVPDARYTFDWRQPPWSIENVRAQFGLEDDAPTQAMYERWCRYTSPENTPDSLRSRDYSIHVNYLTPLVLRQVLDDVIERLGVAARPVPQAMAMVTARNGKDFGFVLQKPNA